MGRLRSSNFGLFAALFAIFLQFAFTSATVPDSRSSLMAGLAMVCTQNGLVEYGDTTPALPGKACDHCTLCHTVRVDVAIIVTPLTFVVAKTMTDAFIGRHTSTLHSFAVDHPTGRGPPTIRI